MRSKREEKRRQDKTRQDKKCNTSKKFQNVFKSLNISKDVQSPRAYVQSQKVFITFN